MVREVRVADHHRAAHGDVDAVPSPHWLGVFYCASEIALSLWKRSSASSATSADRGSIRLLWTVILLSVTAAMFVAPVTPWAEWPGLRALRPLWFVLFALSIGLRWWSIVHLGRFFTVDVAIARDQHVVDDGPYRLVRHPSYTGALGAFLFYGLARAHWLSALVLVVPIGVAFLRRIAIEEDALRQGLGQPYLDYCARTARLIPFVY